MADFGGIYVDGGQNTGGAGAGGNVIQAGAFATSTGTIILSAGNNVTLSTGASSIQINAGGPTLSLTQNYNQQQLGDLMASGSGTASQTFFGSSLFLDRIFIPGTMNLSECDMAMSFGFATTSVSGSMNRSLVIYSFSNSTKLVSLLSTTWGASFTGSNTTTGISTALSQVAAGWTLAGGVIVPMTFASSSLAAGDYVVGNIVNFSLASSASGSLYGVGNDVALAAQTVGAATAVTSATLSVMSTGGLSAGSILTSTASVGALSNGVLKAFGSSMSFLTAANSTAGLTIGATANGGAVSGLGTITTLQIVTTAGSFVSNNVNVSALASAIGTVAASAFTASTAVGAVTNVGLAALGTTSINAITTSLPGFNYLGASSVSTGASSPFQNGIFSTGGIPAAITIAGSNASLTTVGSLAQGQPWFALIGQ